MKNRKLMFSKIAIVAVLGVATVLGCEKSQDTPEEKVEQKIESKSNSEVSIEVLRKYFANLVKVPAERITYVERTEQFQLNGFDQISRKDLIESYQQNIIKH